MLIEQTHRHLVILTVAILKAFTYFFQGFARHDHLLGNGVGVLTFTLDRGQPMAIGRHHRYLSLLEGEECTPQRKARFILGGAKGGFRDHFPDGRGGERQVFSALKGWERRKVFSWEAGNPEIAPAGGQLSPMLLVNAEIEHRSAWQFT